MLAFSLLGCEPEGRQYSRLSVGLPHGRPVLTLTHLMMGLKEAGDATLNGGGWARGEDLLLTLPLAKTRAFRAAADVAAFFAALGDALCSTRTPLAAVLPENFVVARVVNHRINLPHKAQRWPQKCQSTTEEGSRLINPTGRQTHTTSRKSTSENQTEA